jgi:hypothetical protein
MVGKASITSPAKQIPGSNNEHQSNNDCLFYNINHIQDLHINTPLTI